MMILLQLEEILKELGQLQNISASERAVQVRLKNIHKDLMAEYLQIKVS